MLINGISLIILGIIAVPTLFLPGKFINKILPYRSYIGIIYLIAGIIEIIFWFLNIDLIKTDLFIWIIGIICSVAKINLGIMLGNVLLKKAFLGRTENTIRENKNYVDFILFKTTMAIIAIGLGFCQIVICFIL
jgi:hypothetical protein